VSSGKNKRFERVCRLILQGRTVLEAASSSDWWINEWLIGMDLEAAMFYGTFWHSHEGNKVNQ
jgi:hypothetical protein